MLFADRKRCARDALAEHFGVMLINEIRYSIERWLTKLVLFDGSHSPTLATYASLKLDTRGKIAGSILFYLDSFAPPVNRNIAINRPICTDSEFSDDRPRLKCHISLFESFNSSASPLHTSSSFTSSPSGPQFANFRFWMDQFRSLNISDESHFVMLKRLSSGYHCRMRNCNSQISKTDRAG